MLNSLSGTAYKPLQNQQTSSVYKHDQTYIRFFRYGMSLDLNDRFLCHQIGEDNIKYYMEICYFFC